MASKFTKAKSEQAYFKAALYGAAGSGKTFTSLLWAEGLAKRENKRIAFLDTERGAEFYSTDIPDRDVHKTAFDYDRFFTRSIYDAIEAIESIDPAVHGVLIIDSITHLWEAAKSAYNGKLMSNGAIPVQAWSAIKKPYKQKLMTLFLDGKYHAIICGREGVVMEENDEGEVKVVGHRMKAEGETPYEPHILGRMVPDRDKKGGYIYKVFFEKDRSGILSGKEYESPSFEIIRPVVSYLSGESQGAIGSYEDAVERDIAAQEYAKERDANERRVLFETIRNAILTSRNVDELKAAWDLVKGKKTKLGEELQEQLQVAKDARKSDILKLGEVA